MIIRIVLLRRRICGSSMLTSDNFFFLHFKKLFPSSLETREWPCGMLCCRVWSTDLANGSTNRIVSIPMASRFSRGKDQFVPVSLPISVLELWGCHSLEGSD